MIAPVSPLTAGTALPAAMPADEPAVRPGPAQQVAEPVRAPPSVKLTISPLAVTSSDGNYYDPADANQDGRIGELEQQAYDFDHPPSLAESRLINAELRAYADVAGQGRAG